MQLFFGPAPVRDVLRDAKEVEGFAIRSRDRDFFGVKQTLALFAAALASSPCRAGEDWAEASVDASASAASRKRTMRMSCT